MTPRFLDRARAAAGAFRGAPPAVAAPSPAPSGPREDTTGPVSSHSGAAVTNELSGIGGSLDSGAQARPNTARDYLSPEELVSLLRGTIYRRIVQVLPDDALQRGIVITDDTQANNPLEKELRDFDVLGRFRRAAMWGRALGEGFIWPVVEDGGVPLSEPLDTRRVTRLYSLQVLDVRDLSPATYQVNLRRSDQLGLPETYYLHPQRSSAAVPAGATIHHTRLLHFWGDELPPSEWGANTRSNATRADAVGQTIWDALRDLTQSGAAGARLAQELSVTVFYLDKLDAKDSGRGRDIFRAALTRVNQIKSIINGLVLGTNDRVDRLPAQVAGFKELSEAAWDLLHAASGIPAARLRMLAPTGLNTDGESWQQGYYSDVNGWANDRLVPQFARLIPILYRHGLGFVPQWRMEFGPFYHLSQQERAALRLATAQADSLAIQDGLVTRDQVRRSRYGSGGWQLDLQAPTPEDEQELRLGPDAGTDPAEAEAVLAELTGAPGGAQSHAGPAAPAAPMTPEQVKTVQDLLAAVSSKGLTPEAGRLLLEAVVPADRAAALVQAQAGPQVVPGAMAPTQVAPVATEDDAPDLSAQRELAASMTEHGVDRCSHGRVNECERCGVRRIHALSLGADGKPVKDAEGRPVWAVKWRAIGDKPAKAEDHPAGGEITTDRADADHPGAMLAIALSEAGQQAWRELVQRAEAVTGPLQGYDEGEVGIQEPPHVTVLYLGRVDPLDVAGIQERAGKVASGFGPLSLLATRVGTLPAGPASGSRVPVVAELDAWALVEMNDQLLRSLARFVSADQFPRYRAHVTLGFAPALTPEQVASLAELVPDRAAAIPLGGAAALDLHVANQVVARLPFTGERQDNANGREQTDA